MLSISEFKSFMGYSTGGSEGSPAYGILVITKADSSDQSSYDFPADGQWSPSGSGLNFYNPDRWTLSESARHIEIGVQSKTRSSRYNIEANLQWPPQQGIVITNPAAFTQGADPTPASPGLYPGLKSPPDVRLQSAIDTGKGICSNMMGLKEGDDFPDDDPLVKEAVFLLGAYKLQNTHFQQLVAPVSSASPTAPMTTVLFRDRTFKPLMNQVFQLLSHRIDFSRLINEKPPTPSMD